MDKLEVQITYKGQTFKFEDGLKAYIFNLGIQYGIFDEFGFDVLLQFVDKVYEVANIPSTTWVEDIVKHVAEHWEELKEMDADDVFDDFANNKEDF